MDGSEFGSGHIPARGIPVRISEVRAVPVPGTNDVEIHVTGELPANVVRKTLAGFSIGAVPIYCMSDIHHVRKETRGATNLGWFRAPHWNSSRRERAAYCAECSKALMSIGAFDPDE